MPGHSYGRGSASTVASRPPECPAKSASTRWVGATATVSDGSPSAVAARRATHANDHQRGLPTHRHGTLPPDLQMVPPVAP